MNDADNIELESPVRVKCSERVSTIEFDLNLNSCGLIIFFIEFQKLSSKNMYKSMLISSHILSMTRYKDHFPLNNIIMIFYNWLFIEFHEPELFSQPSQKWQRVQYTLFPNKFKHYCNNFYDIPTFPIVYDPNSSICPNKVSFNNFR